MRIRKVLFLKTVILFFGCLCLYVLISMRHEDTSEENKDAVENELQLGNTFNYKVSNKEVATKLNKLISLVDLQLQNLVHNETSNQKEATSDVTIQILSVYEKLKFDNVDGGAWKQGWNIEYDANQWNPQNKLKVFVMPHSHNDPGWLNTFEEYYQSKTKSILNSMVTKLIEDKRRKFIWAEISFFSLWWQEISKKTKQMVKLLLARKQLEIVTGGWVMNDEANTHYFSIIQQLTRGHQWLQQHLNITPKFGWAIDPFGHSPMMPYVLKQMGFEALLIQRTHYCVKKYLAKNKQLEFRWRQLWDGSGKTDFLSHMMPFYSYDIPHTCGPDPMVCCQFDFKRLPGYGLHCPWGVPPQLITESNVAARAQLLLDQYRKKSQLYSTNILLVPLGDDFRYDSTDEWDAQFSNYQKLFDYMNNDPTLNVEVQFGTLSDYFNALTSEKSVDQFPSLSGDFFTYADKDDNYWSGYYTTRPFYKRMDRELQAYLRSADILFTVGWMEAMRSVHIEWLTSEKAKLYKILQDARSSLSLFQHHDGITGTAKKHVVENYAQKLYSAIHGCQHVIQQVVHFLLSPTKEDYEPSPDYQFFNMDDIRRDPKSLSEQQILTFNSGSGFHKVVFHNSLTWHRTEVVSLRVDSPDLQVKNLQGTIVKSQVSPLCQLTDIYMKCYLLSFVAEVKPLGLAMYIIETTSKDSNRAIRSHIRALNAVDNQFFEGWEKDFDGGREFSIQNDKLIATFGTDGLLKALAMKLTGHAFPVQLSFVKYGAKLGHDRSGAYLFMPDGEGKTIHHDSPLILVFEGPVMSQVVVWLPHVLHSIVLYNSPGADSMGLEVHNLVNLTGIFENYELSMRLSTNINNGDTFYTDLNGFQIIKRKRFDKLPIQAHFYPMPSAAYIEDKSVRLSVASAQPLGVTSLKSGQLEVMQDRRLTQDDNRGLGEGVMDNKPTLTMFRLNLERRTETCSLEQQESYMSAASYLLLYSLNYPIHHMVWLGDTQGLLKTMYSPVTTKDTADVHLVSLTTLIYPAVAAGVVLHKVNTDTCFTTDLQYEFSSVGQVDLSSLLPTKSSHKLYTTSLSFLSVGTPQNVSQVQTLQPMDMKAFMIPKQSN